MIPSCPAFSISAAREYVAYSAVTWSVGPIGAGEELKLSTKLMPKNLGDYRATGFLPTFLNDFVVMGLIGEGEAYL